MLHSCCACLLQGRPGAQVERELALAGGCGMSTLSARTFIILRILHILPVLLAGLPGQAETDELCLQAVCKLSVHVCCCRDGVQHKVERELALAGGRSMAMFTGRYGCRTSMTACVHLSSIAAGKGSNTR
jgi:hypothetical protein